MFFGELTNEKNKGLKDLNLREQWTLIPLVIIAFWIGLYPKPFFTRMGPAVDRVMARVEAATGQGDEGAERIAAIARTAPAPAEAEHGE